MFPREYNKVTDNLYRDNITDNITENVRISMLYAFGVQLIIVFLQKLDPDSLENITFNW